MEMDTQCVIEMEKGKGKKGREEGKGKGFYHEMGVLLQLSDGLGRCRQWRCHGQSGGAL
jgi:hypothetical protein